ncbi:MAG: hypothetical protein A2W00_11660 [Candidatus Eisenbacteria bacterium RBG_16_71_46]|nr:MAG: hypothetical protein A2W00_11660 [Candidatus Eisenbacteria bacterium RBG_16_71_46]
MRRSATALAAVLFLITSVDPAACAPARTASPFEPVPIPPPPRHSHAWAYAALAAGAGLVAASFPLTNHANRTYEAYLRETDPDRIDQLYDETVRFDHLAGSALITGEVLLAAGLYLRFIRAPAPSRVLLTLTPSRCALALRF